MAKFYKPQFSVQYINGVFMLAMNPQMSKLLMDEIMEQGETLNCTVVAQIPLGNPAKFSPAEAMQELCNHSSNFFLRNLGSQFAEILEELREKRQDYLQRQREDMEEEDVPPPYGRR